MEPLARRELLTLAGTAAVATGTAAASAGGGGRTRRTASQSSLQDWSSHQFDRGNTGYNPDAAGVPDAPARQWHVDTGAKIHRNAGPILVEGAVLVPNEDGLLNVFDAASGETLARFDTEAASIPTTPAAGSGNVFVGGDGSPLYALERGSGEVQWTREFPGGGFRGSPTHDDGTLFAARGDLFALDAATGDQRWRNEEIGSVDGGVAVDDDHVYAFEAGGDEVYAVDRNDGSLVGSASLPSTLQAEHFQITLADERLYVGGRDGTVYAVDAASGDRLWRFQSDEDPTERVAARSSPAVFDGTVYAGNQDGYVYALDAEDGSVKWRAGTGNRVVCSPAVAAGVVYVGGTRGQLYALDAATGETLWTHTVDGPVNSSLVVSGDRVYVPTHDGRVLALSPQRESDDDGASSADDNGASTARDADRASGFDGSDDAAGAQQRQRGFISNDGNGPEPLENVFNLTMLGFLLSIAGIVHQMLGGR